MKGLFTIYFSVCFTFIYAQSSVGMVYEELPNDSLQSNSVSVHSAIKPMIRQKNDLPFADSLVAKKANFSIIPLADVQGAYSKTFGYRAGLGVMIELSSKKWYGRAAATAGIGSVDSIFRTNAFYQEQKGNSYVYTDVRARIGFTPNNFFNFQAGIDNHFIGQGNRSLFLSDYGVPFPFAQIRTRFWRLEYTVMYQFFREKFGANYRSKNGAMHHISLNATKWLNIGIFEI